MPLPTVAKRKSRLENVQMRLVALEQTEELTARDRYENDEDSKIVGYLLARMEKRKLRIAKSRQFAGELEAMGSHRRKSLVSA